MQWRECASCVLENVEHCGGEPNHCPCPKPDVFHKKQAILLPSVHNIYVSYARDLLKVAGK